VYNVKVRVQVLSRCRFELLSSPDQEDSSITKGLASRLRFSRSRQAFLHGPLQYLYELNSITNIIQNMKKNIKLLIIFIFYHWSVVKQLQTRSLYDTYVKLFQTLFCDAAIAISTLCSSIITIALFTYLGFITLYYYMCENYSVSLWPLKVCSKNWTRLFTVERIDFWQWTNR
jgi:hypothetical protein